MKIFWIVIANFEKAYIYSVNGSDMKIELIKSFSHVESKFKKSDLVSDRPGHYVKGSSNSIRGSYAMTTDPKDLEIDNFAKKICFILEKGRVNNNYTDLIIVAEPSFCGTIKKMSHKNLIKIIKYNLNKDYANYPKNKLKSIIKTDIINALPLN